MSPDIGAPGTDVSRRDFVKATGTVGVAGLADCTVGYRRPRSRPPRIRTTAATSRWPVRRRSPT